MRKFSTDTLALAEQNINTFSKTFFIGLTVHKPPFLPPFPFFPSTVFDYAKR
jgi:hypothetical protein